MQIKKKKVTQLLQQTSVFLDVPENTQGKKGVCAKTIFSISYHFPHPNFSSSFGFFVPLIFSTSPIS